MNNSDINNPRRLVRAIEIEEYYLSLRIPAISNNSPLLTGDYLLIGLKISEKLLAQKINDRVEKRYKQGILEEIQKLLISGFNFDYPSMSGLGYSEWKNYFISSKFKVHSSKKIEIINKIKELWKLHERQYVKKQMTFLKKIPNINWFDASKPKFYSLIETKVGSWYNKNT
jgi:tRNA dimethylallyltransferase